MNADELARSKVAELPATMSKGQRALEALEIYTVLKLPVPASVLREIIACYRDFRDGKRPAYRPDLARAEGAPNTLGEAFGIPDHRGGAKTALKRRREALLMPQLVALFTGEDALPRAKAKARTAAMDGYEAAAARLGIPAKRVEQLLPKVRRRPRT